MYFEVKFDKNNKIKSKNDKDDHDSDMDADDVQAEGG